MEFFYLTEAETPGLVSRQEVFGTILPPVQLQKGTCPNVVCLTFVSRNQWSETSGVRFAGQS